MLSFYRLGTFALVMTLLSVLLPIKGSAQTLTVAQYQHPRSEKDLSSNKAYLNGIKDGVVALNVTAEEKLFCLPEMSTLTFERASDILLRWARSRGGNADSLPLGLAMVHSLKEAFPCSNRR